MYVTPIQPILLTDFCISLKKIEGTTYVDRYKNFHKLLNKFAKSKPPSELIDLFGKSFHPTTIYEEIFQVDVLVRFKQFHHLLNLLKKDVQNKRVISRVLRQNWIFKQDFAQFTPEYFVKELLDKVSYYTRNAILMKLADHFTDENIASNFFEAVKDFFGLSVANRMLPCCSEDKVLNVVLTYGVKLTRRHILRFVKRNPFFLEKYYRHCRFEPAKRYFRRTCGPSLKYLAAEHPLIFKQTFCDHQELDVQFNRRETVILYRNIPDVLVENSKRFLKCVRLDQLLWLLRRDGMRMFDFFFNLFPDEITSLKQDNFNMRMVNLLDGLGIERSRRLWCTGNPIWCVLMYTPEHFRYTLISATFIRKYGIDILDHKHFITRGVMEMVPLPLVERYVMKKLHRDPDLWTMYLPIHKSFPYYMERLESETEPQRRGNLYTLLVESCRFNANRYENLLNILEYFFNESEKEHGKTRTLFLEAVIENYKLDRLKEHHWYYIIKLLDWFEGTDFYCPKTDDFQLAYCKFLLINNKPMKDILVQILDAQPFNHLNIFKEIPAYEKKCLILSGYIIPDSFEGEDLIAMEHKFIFSILDWNKRHPRDPFKLNSYPFYLNVFLNNLKIDSPPIESVQLLNVIMTDTNLLNTLNLYPFVWKLFNSSALNRTIAMKKVLKYNPESTITHFQFLLDKEMPPIHEIWPIVCKYDHIQLPEKLIQYCKEKLKQHNPTEVLQKICYTTPLLYLLPTSEAVPVAFKNLDFSRDVMKAFRFNRPISDTMDGALQYYLIEVIDRPLRIIHRGIEHTSSEYNIKLLYDLWDRPEPLKIDVMCLAKKVLNNETKFEFFKNILEKDNDPILQRSILKILHRNFMKNPSDQSLDLLISCKSLRPEGDKNIYLFLLKTTKMPVVYKARYIEFVWDFWECVDESIRTKRHRLFLFLERLPLVSLRTEFFHKVFEQVFLTSCYLENEVIRFAFKFLYVTDTEEELDSRTAYLFKICKIRKDREWNRIKSEFCKRVTKFIDWFCHESYITNAPRVLQTTYIHFLKVFTAEEMFDDYIHLNLTLLSLRCEEDGDYRLLTQGLVACLEQMHQYYESDLILKKFIAGTTKMLEQIGCDVIEEYFIFLKDLVACRTSRVATLYLIGMLPKGVSRIKKIQKKHINILKTLKTDQDLVVQIELRKYLSEMEFPNSVVRYFATKRITRIL